MEENTGKKIEKEKERINFKKYAPIASTDVVDAILEEMREKKIFPSVGIQNVALMFAKKVKVQQYIVSKFTEQREKILSEVEKRNAAKESKKGKFTAKVTKEHKEMIERAMKDPNAEYQPWTRQERWMVEKARKEAREKQG